MEFMNKGMVVMLMISLPCVLTAAGIGLVVGILQAVTQVQEQTIAAAPKILAVFLVLMIFSMGFTRMLTELVQEATQLAFNVIPKNEAYALDANYYKYTKPFAEEMDDNSFKNIPSVDEVMNNAGKAPFVSNSERVKYNAASKQANPTPSFIERKKIMGQ